MNGMAGPTEAEIEVARMLRDELLVRPQFWNRVDVEQVRLEGGHPATELVVLLRLSDRPEVLYSLHTTLSAWSFPKAGLPEPTPAEWAVWVYNDIMEAVDAGSGLPVRPPGDDGVVSIDLDQD